jgi:deoxycytidylate deaminase
MRTYGEALLQLKRGFLIIGLTGYTGSGCSTACNMLSQKQKPEIPQIGDLKGSVDPVDYEKLVRAWSGLSWQSFTRIEVSAIIFMILLQQAFEEPDSDGPLAHARNISGNKRDYLSGLNLLLDHGPDLRNLDTAKRLVDAYKTARSLYGKFKRRAFENLDSFIEGMQNFGDAIRKYGQPRPHAGSSPDPANIFILPEAIRRLVKAFRTAEGATEFVIEAFRNPYEVEYFKRRYREFYLVCINRLASDRRKVLASLSPKFGAKLEKREKGKLIPDKRKDNIHDWVTSQNIDECAQKADYFIQNYSDKKKSCPPQLLYHLARLICLTKYPGCIPPTKDERSMQVAMSARQNSGCLSRHVGAVVTDDRGFILGVGWNDTPGGQVPCSLRTAHQLLNNPDKHTFSEYERSIEFVEHIRARNLGLNPFCFKEELAAIRGLSNGAEFTRAVHAEENALLQAARHGTDMLRESHLYTTDSPCTLCAKKAYQMGVKRIVYIEEYPGIAMEQTLKSGTHAIEIDQFEGVTGSAYFSAFTTLLPEKDFLNLYV